MRLFVRQHARAIQVLALVSVLTLSTLPTIGCGPQSTAEFKSDLKKAAVALNTAAKENRLLYQSKVFGAKALEIRVKVATAINKANGVLTEALNIAKNITPATFSGDKTLILQFLAQAVSELAAAHIGNDKIDLLLQGAAAVINSAILVIQALQTVQLRQALPAIQDAIRGVAFPSIEIAIEDMQPGCLTFSFNS